MAETRYLELDARLREHMRRAHGLDPLPNHYSARLQHEYDHDYGYSGYRWQHDVQDWYLGIEEG